jgi:hypothetical protein
MKVIMLDILHCLGCIEHADVSVIGSDSVTRCSARDESAQFLPLQRVCTVWTFRLVVETISV